MDFLYNFRIGFFHVHKQHTLLSLPIQFENIGSSNKPLDKTTHKEDGINVYNSMENQSIHDAKKMLLKHPTFHNHRYDMKKKREIKRCNQMSNKIREFELFQQSASCVYVDGE